MDVIRNLPMNDTGRGTLIGRIGNSDAARPFLIGTQYAGHARIEGRLFIAINQTSIDRATGSYHVTIERSAGTAKSVAQVNLPPLPPESARLHTTPRE